jgi:hypothetical protein
LLEPGTRKNGIGIMIEPPLLLSVLSSLPVGKVVDG